MNDSLEKKLREARFFVDKMREREDMAFGDPEPFDFFLSAFLSAARTALYAARDEGNKKWRTSGWDAKLDPRQKEFVKFFVDERNDQVHEIVSSHVPSRVSVPFSGSYSDASGTLTVFAPPMTLGFPAAPADLTKPVHHYVVQGVQQKVVDVCAEYCDLLAQL
jgi:hypothetical protein